MNINEIITIIVACISVIGSLSAIFFAFHLKKNGTITKEELEIKIKNETENIEKQVETIAHAKDKTNKSSDSKVTTDKLIKEDDDK